MTVLYPVPCRVLVVHAHDVLDGELVRGVEGREARREPLAVLLRQPLPALSKGSKVLKLTTLRLSCCRKGVGGSERAEESKATAKRILYPRFLS